ncbi:leucine-rich repeat serine/threonine-protein kinase 1-like [Diaphorina citri]|uniref:non-specific serine/threonine protein kinase n=1 Tax=Diaphorina citri TaxID=121845 RepID=A0A3Q0IZP8_DIACI|nr:leucine-rich repeat serine/threonine-protein kinase 1-like [Diaphorina citri]
MQRYRYFHNNFPLQFNRLETIPEDIFHLPCLITLDLSNNKLQALSSQMWRSPKLKELNVAFNLLKELPTIHNAEDAMSDAGSVCSLESSRSAESNPDPSTPSPYDCDTRFNENRQNMKLLPLSHHNVWSHAGVDVTEHLPHSGGGVDGTDPGGDTPCCPLLSLNLAHNQFTSIPPVLPCLAVNLTKLNMAYNSLRSMSHITSYPNSLKQLDLSHNKISCWPSLPQIDSTDPMELAAVTCYCPDNATAKSHLGPLLRGRQSLRTSVLSSVCIHRRHLRLDSLRTLILADNNITRIQLSTDDDGEGPSAAGSFDELEGDVCLMRTRLMFPNLSKFINIVDAEKCGLPRVLDTIEISCKTRHNIKLLCNLIYDTVFSLRPPGSKELLLEQKVPASYLALEDVVGFLAADRKANGLDPVLSGDQYRTLVSTEMSNRCQRTFRDAAELHQATLFLHDNGVLLHYDDVTLRDLYFLDPQWLCDMLAHVVTIREINPFARAGLMQLSDLSLVFKNTKIGSLDTKGYIVNLLNKFEVALTWDSRTLLIPSLLPTEPDLTDPNAQIVKVKIPVRTRGWAVRHKKISATSNATAVPYFGTPTHDQTSSSTASTAIEVLSNGEDGVELSTRGDPETAIRRLLLMSYFPSGFWSRLMTRILADDAVVDIVRAFFIIPKQVLQSAKLSQAIDKRAEWILWQTGMELRFSDTVLFRMREVSHITQPGSVDYRAMNLRIKQEGLWQDVDLSTASILEILLPSDTIVIKQPIRDENEPIGYQAIVLEPSPERTAQLLALAVDHIDVLLEDWYPTLGTRFVHTSEGKFLVTRLIPCPRCLSTSSSGGGDNVDPAYNPPPSRPPLAVPSGSDDGWEGGEEGWRVRKSQESYTSDGDSGVGRDSTCSSRKPSVEGHPHLILAEECTDQLSVPPQYSWMVEECILAAYDKDSVKCPVHGEILLAHIAPDTMFLDLGDRHLIRPASITRGKLLGRGAFGFVFKGSCKVRGSSSTSIDVAMKMLQPVQPGPGASQSAILAYQGAQGKWARDPLQYASKAYCTARQELNILLTLRHSNIVPLVGVCTRPLALVLDLAPLGALDAMLRHYRRSGASLAPSTLQQTILQIAKALEYLHQQHIIYRDLKSENQVN